MSSVNQVVNLFLFGLLRLSSNVIISLCDACVMPNFMSNFNCQHIIADVDSITVLISLKFFYR